MYIKWPKLAFCMHTDVLLYYTNNLITVCKQNVYKLHAYFDKGVHVFLLACPSKVVLGDIDTI